MAEVLPGFVACSKQDLLSYQVIVWKFSGFIGHDSVDAIMLEFFILSIFFCSCH